MKPRAAAHNAFACALCPLIPLPLVDVFFKRRFMRELYRDIGRGAGHELEEEALVALSKVHSNFWLGCLVACLWYPIRKLFKTVLYVFTVKECFDWGTEAIHRGWMVQRAFELGHLPGQEEEVWVAMEATFQAEVSSPVGRLLRGKPTPEPPRRLNDPEKLPQLMDWLHQRGGGAILMGEFERRLTAEPAAKE